MSGRKEPPTTIPRGSCDKHGVADGHWCGQSKIGLEETEIRERQQATRVARGALNDQAQPETQCELEILAFARDRVLPLRNKPASLHNVILKTGIGRVGMQQAALGTPGPRSSC